jgi:hypothetical protein
MYVITAPSYPLPFEKGPNGKWILKPKTKRKKGCEPISYKEIFTKSKYIIILQISERTLLMCKASYLHESTHL